MNNKITKAWRKNNDYLLTLRVLSSLFAILPSPSNSLACGRSLRLRGNFVGPGGWKLDCARQKHFLRHHELPQSHSGSTAASQAVAAAAVVDVVDAAIERIDGGLARCCCYCCCCCCCVRALQAAAAAAAVVVALGCC